MLKPEFIEVAQKYEQLNDTHIAEYKESALVAQVLDHDTMVSNFTRNFFTHSYDFCSASITKYISGELITRIYNDALTYQIAVTSMEIILEVFGNICVKEISAFFELDEEVFAKEVEQLLLEEYSKALELATVVQDHCKIHSITYEWNASYSELFQELISATNISEHILQKGENKEIPEQQSTNASNSSEIPM